MLKGRQLAQAKRCQLLTGSFEGRRDGCSCTDPDDCTISPQIHDEAIKDKRVIAYRDKKIADWSKEITAVTEPPIVSGR